MGLEMLLGPIMLKILAVLAVVVGLVATYFGIKHKGVKEERARQEVIRVEVQGKVNEAKVEDIRVDAEVQAKIEALPTAPKPSATAPKVGDKFKF